MQVQFDLRQSGDLTKRSLSSVKISRGVRGPRSPPAATGNSAPAPAPVPPPDAPRRWRPHRQRPLPHAPAPRPQPTTGTRSRVCSVPRQVGSLPWSAVKIARSPGRSAPGTAAAGRRTIPARGHSRRCRAGGHRACRTRQSSQRSRNRAPPRPQPHQMFEKVSIAFALPQLADAAHRKDVADLADGMGRPPRPRHPGPEAWARAARWHSRAVRGAA
jgi:hypothetical protein